MRLLTLTISGLLMALTQVLASPVVPREGYGSCADQLVQALQSRGLTTSADIWRAGLKSNKELADAINGPDLLTVLIPENNAYGYGYHSTDTNVLLYSIIYGTPENFFEIPSNGTTSRRGANQSRTHGSTRFRSMSLGPRKRWLDLLPNNQVQVVDQTFTSSSERQITISNTVGDSKVINRFTVCQTPRDILVIDTVPVLPGAVSDALSKSLLETTPQGLTKFRDALKKAGCLSYVDNANSITIFAPTDEAFKKASDPWGFDPFSNVNVKNHYYSDPRILYSSRIESTRQATAASGKQLEFRQENGVKYVKCGTTEAIWLRSDVITQNGVLHVIDRVLKC